MKLSERKSEIKGIFYNNCKDIIDMPPSFATYTSEKYTDCGTITEEGIKFSDGSLLNFFEEIKNEQIGRYGYEYIRPDTGFFFHYENEGIENGIKKPLHHLHVGIMKKHAGRGLLDLLPEELLEHKGPHFKAPEMKFHEFMGIIVANFFSGHKNYEKMLISLGRR